MDLTTPLILSDPINAIGVITGCLYLLAMAILLARPVLGDGLRYKTRIPGIFFSIGAGLIITAIEPIIVIGSFDAEVAFVGWFLIACGAVIGVHFCWFVFPTLYPEFFAESDAPEDEPDRR